MIRKLLALSLSTTLILSGCGQGTVSTPPGNGNANTTPPPTPTTAPVAIKHVVVIFGENISFDHYFGTYPNAANLPGETPFAPATAATVAAATLAGTTSLPATPANMVNYISTPSLLTANPNLNSANNVAAMNSNPSNPFRLAPAQAATADQDHAYNPEQLAFDNGKMDLFPISVGTPDSSALPLLPNLAAVTNAPPQANTTALTMGYYDGNTVTALWNYAQHYAVNDHSFGTTFGPSTPGALNLASGQTNGVINPTGAASAIVADGQGGFTDINDDDPTGDICSSTSANFSMSGKNIGDLLNAAKITWGFFEGGFDLTVTNSNGTTGCGRNTAAVNIPTHPTKADYIPHHQPFQYYASTANLNHLRPTAAIGTTDQANHQYDMHDFTDALAAGNMPAVSFLKAPGYQDAHAGYSDPLDEQTFVVNTVNAIEKSSFWSSTAIIIAYDDSDGWYDHLTDIVNGSASVSDAAICTGAAAASLPGPNSNGAPVQGRCGHGPRMPFLVISPWAKKNYIDNTPTDQASIPRFIEDVFLSSQRIGGGSFDASAGALTGMFNFTSTVVPNPNVVVLDPTTGKVTSGN
ncbi:phospholipase C [Tunturiibacter gelidoferens]|uniref:Alkaline phosphatase family protein n=2 Tax=Tunturiibacter gelidiferens TaxID=3069689 RepID=A0AAU7Z3Q3_9BACT|nr:alkaline phosphatase family protein [Edaphobacter lichenicola]MBB5340806.1 phospholipase C [Edaphobacter lichenicola]